MSDTSYYSLQIIKVGHVTREPMTGVSIRSLYIVGLELTKHTIKIIACHVCITYTIILPAINIPPDIIIL